MDALPVAGFFAALILTTIWFDQLEDNQYGLPLQAVYAITWGLLGAAVLLVCAIESPSMVARDATLLGGGFALGTTVELLFELVKRRRICLRNMRWLVAAVVVLGSTFIAFQTNAPDSIKHVATGGQHG